MKTLVTCLILTVFAVCSASPQFQHFTETLNAISPPLGTHRISVNKLSDVLQYAEQVVAFYIADMTDAFCPKDKIDWQEAWNETLALNAVIDVQGETLCSLVTNHIEEVLEPFWSRMEQCENAQYSGPLSRSVVLALKSVAVHVCSITGEQIIEHLNPCAFKGTFTAPQCKQFKYKMRRKSEPAADTFVKELCSILPLGKDCLMDAIGQNCKLDFTKKAWEDLFNAILSPCSNIS